MLKSDQPGDVNLIEYESDAEAHPYLDKLDRIDPANAEFRLLDLEALVAMKLTSYRRKDQVHLLDMLEIGQIDETWLDRVPPSLRDRLQALIDDPDG